MRAFASTNFSLRSYGQSQLGELPSAGFGGFMGAGSYSTPPTPAGPSTAMFQLNPSVAECLPDVGVFGHSFGSGGMPIALCDASIKNISRTMTPNMFSRSMSPGKGDLLNEWAE